MAALTDLSDLVNRLSGGNSGTPENLHLFIDSRVSDPASAAANATVAGRMTSLWQYNKSPGGSGAIPTAAANPVNDTAGAFFQTDPGGGRQKWLLGCAVSASAVGSIRFYDRLAHQGGLSGTVTTEQTTNLPLTINRWSSTPGNRIFLELYVLIGTTATTVTVRYTNSAGTGSRTTKAVSFGGTGLREIQRIIECPLQDGDVGVNSVQGVTVLATTGTAGNFGVTIARPLTPTIPILAVGAGAVRNFLTGFPSGIDTIADTCIWPVWFAGSTTAPQVSCSLSFVEK